MKYRPEHPFKSGMEVILMTGFDYPHYSFSKEIVDKVYKTGRITLVSKEKQAGPPKQYTPNEPAYGIGFGSREWWIAEPRSLGYSRRMDRILEITPKSMEMVRRIQAERKAQYMKRNTWHLLEQLWRLDVLPEDVQIIHDICRKYIPKPAKDEEV